jgi:hypothetical protein
MNFILQFELQRWRFETEPSSTLIRIPSGISSYNWQYCIFLCNKPHLISSNGREKGSRFLTKNPFGKFIIHSYILMLGHINRAKFPNRLFL